MPVGFAKQHTLQTLRLLMTFILALQAMRFTYDFEKSPLRLKWSIQNMYRHHLGGLLYNPVTVLCSNRSHHSAHKLRRQLNSVLREESLCQITEQGNSSFHAACGGHEIDWTYTSTFVPIEPAGCREWRWDLSFAPISVEFTANRVLSGILLSFCCVTLSIFTKKSTIPGLASLFAFHVINLISKHDAELGHQFMCFLCSLLLFTCAWSVEGFCTKKIPLKFAIAFVITGPFLLSALVGTSCASFATPLLAVRACFSLMFGDYVFPSFLEMRSAASVATLFGAVLMFLFIPMNLAGIVDLMTKLFTNAKKA